MIAKTTKRPLSAPHGQLAGDVLAALDVSSTIGLSEAQAIRRLQQHGPNSIGPRKKVGALAVPVHQFQSLVVALLAVAAGLAFYFREWEEGGAIVGVLTLNTVIGFLTEIKAARSIEALRVLGTRSAPGAQGWSDPSHSGRALGSGRHRPARSGGCRDGGSQAGRGVEPGD